jgi:hypothetical protein
MKAPDKIYICIERTYGASDGQVIAMVTPHNERQSVNDIEYIRKDALLDWIKEQLAENAEWREVNPDDRFFGGKEVAFNRIIDKINSM